MNISTRLLNNIKGFLDKEEGKSLYDFALKASKLGPCLEIGSYCGKSAVYLGTGCRKNNGILFSIDHHRGSEEQQPGEEYFDPELFNEKQGKIDTFVFFRKTIEQAGLEDTVIPIVSSSENTARMWNTSLSLVFIDGGHTFKTAYRDYNSWAGHIMPGGFLLIHDIFKNPEQGGQAPYYIYKLAIKSGLFKELPMTKTLGILQRRHCAEIPDDLPLL
ncbi:SAM-dependent methyltransgerase domain-containing protein [Desulfonema limicola]|uniref:SAM-dependent methyltransgerase domain-containing protein n=1 Tax=Desulfonema limicola TaxID=45656 RepID=A0A975BEJ7_9BACT|nr:class I SAM-dependent methyltransferase [Desulfonema limicola]QTA83942.1 SAM-dependent methyltransgerase domain-containing protein [Desulfonema limicola]